ncbi:ABC transporter substrate-binding protein [Marinilabilia salmonicolor]|uniref:Iron complex transport system substrate-binding protein n=1 Tax=Marinilabilia salmonicolor TaxID=989 RepID=A0A2T0XBA2_9BACT|nr:ABC transporter substrate-binding protein [Marinilabilia salmonicolor]PRY96220.1 iron complex transport system substrate-binding protein [Marinilabilia salmonicolor]RCW35314.1 iron complex transport system substrate-binding protein [Marinilabilia salmonicolor]
MSCKLCSSLLLIVFFLSCSVKQQKGQSASGNIENIELKYAHEFSLQKQGNRHLLTVFMDEDHSDQSARKFTLVKDSADAAGIENVIHVPCKKIVCVSSTQLAYFFALEDIDDIVAINSSRYLFHEEMNARVAEGKVKQIGKEGNFNLEVLAALNPDVIFVSPFKAGGYDVLRNMGIPLVPMAAYNEMTPLGRAEWLKMMALFVGQETKADTIFNKLAKRYNELKDQVAGIDMRPTVFSGKMRSGSWYVPGGDSFYARLFRDAGADYVVDDNEQGAYPVDFETIYRKAYDADFWRLVHPEKIGLSLPDFLQQDVRYADFKAARERNVLLCNIREKPYYEQSAVKPDVLLADYIHFFHSEVLPGYEPFFYERLK